MRARLLQLRRQVADERGGQVVFLSHCLLNQNVRYLGGAEHQAGVRNLVEGYLADGVGVFQMPCPEERAWGGVLKRRMLIAYGAGGTWRSPLVRALFGPFMSYTRLVYARLARGVAARVVDYQDSGMEVVGVVGIGGSPSCGVRTTLDLHDAVDVLRRCPLAQLDRRMVTEQVVGAHLRPGEGIFMAALDRALVRRGTTTDLDQYTYSS